MNHVKLLKRINLGNYSHWELEVFIEDEDEDVAMEKAYALMDQGLESLGENRIGVKRG